MQAFTSLSSRGLGLLRNNIDTDLIIPSRYLKTISRHGLGAGTFYTLRFAPDGTPIAGNPFDAPENQGAQILISGANFGCGSSREHAAWGLADLGFKVVVAPSFADIFASNAFKNGILCIALPEAEIAELAAMGGEITIDLEEQKITRPDQRVIRFDYDPFKKRCLLAGMDEIGLTLESDAAITGFETGQRAQLPWLYKA